MAEQYMQPKRRPLATQEVNNVQKEPTVTPEEIANTQEKVNNSQNENWEEMIKNQYEDLMKNTENKKEENKPVEEEKVEEQKPVVEKKVDTEEDLKKKELEKKHNDIANKNNASHLILFNLGTDDEYIAAVEKEFEEDPRPESAKTSEPTKYASGIAACSQIGQKNHQQKLLSSWIAEKIASNTDALKEVATELRLAKITPKIGDGNGPKKLTGIAAKTAVISRMKGMYRVQLYNSGFWLTLRKPSLIEIDSWMQSIDADFKEIGRILGGHAHAIVDCFVKEKLMEILPSMIITSNYENWTNTQDLVANISFHDYDTILWALCCMLYADGVGVSVYCTNPECRNIDESQFIDLKDICYIDTTLFNQSAVEWMLNNSRANAPLLSTSDLVNYRNNILGFKKTVVASTTNYEYELVVPTMDKYLENATKLVANIVKLLNGKNDIQNEQAGNQLTFHLYKMLTPWIKTLVMKDDAGNVMYRIEDKDAIYESLSIEDYDKSNLYTDIVDFIKSTRIAYFAAATLHCSKCGKDADIKTNNLVPFDMQYLFFCLSCLQLEQTGASY